MANKPSLARGAITLYDAAKLRQIAKNSAEQLQTLENIREQGEATAQELNDISSKMDIQINIQKRQHILSEQAAMEKKEQKLLKNVLFSFKMDYENSSQIGSGVRKYVMLKILLVIYENELMDLIGKLDEIQDKEFAANLYKSLSGDAKQCLTVLKENETTDLENIRRLSSKAASIKSKISELDNQINLSRLELYQQSKKNQEKTPGPLGLAFSMVLGIITLVILMGEAGFVDKSIKVIFTGWLALLPFINARKRYKKQYEKLKALEDEMKSAEKTKAALIKEMENVEKDATFNSFLTKYELQEIGIVVLHSM